MSSPTRSLSVEAASRRRDERVPDQSRYRLRRWCDVIVTPVFVVPMQGPNPPEEIKNPIHLTFWGLKTRRDIYRGVGPCYDPLKDIVLPPVQVSAQKYRIVQKCSKMFRNVGSPGRVNCAEEDMSRAWFSAPRLKSLNIIRVS